MVLPRLLTRFCVPENCNKNILNARNRVCRIATMLRVVRRTLFLANEGTVHRNPFGAVLPSILKHRDFIVLANTLQVRMLVNINRSATVIPWTG